MGESFLDKNGGGFDINGLKKDYYVWAGENINAGSFVEFINGVASTTTVTSSDTKLSTTTKSGYAISAVELQNGNVFIAHSNFTSNYLYLYGIVVMIDGATITYGTDTQLSSSCEAKYISTVLLPSGNVFISWGSNGFYGVVCSINGTTITTGTSKSISSGQNTACISSCLLNNGNVFISYNNPANTNYYLYGVVASINGTTITYGTKTQIGSKTYTGYRISSVLLQNGNVFIAHSYNETIALYGIVCSVSGTTITKGTDTSISSNFIDDYMISSVLLQSGKVFIVYTGTSKVLKGVVISVSGTSISSGTETTLNSTSSSGYSISTNILENGYVSISHPQNTYGYLCIMIASINSYTITVESDKKVSDTAHTATVMSLVSLSDNIFIAHSNNNTNYYLNAQIFGVTNKTPTSSIEIPTYETQVRNTTTSSANGISKTSGSGGTSTGHNQQVKIYVPDV